MDLLFSERELANGNTAGTFGFEKLNEEKMRFLSSILRHKFDLILQTISLEISFCVAPFTVYTFQATTPFQSDTITAIAEVELFLSR